MKTDGLPNWDWKIPVDLIKCKPDNVVVYPNDDRNTIVAAKNGSFECRVIGDLKSMKTRYTLAFMYSCIKVHSPKQDVALSKNQFNPSTRNFRDSMCQKQTGAYLMPKAALEYHILKKSVTSISELAVIYNVSELAMHQRLKFLKMI
ncbi:ImmA/IrrE family metallo-endopeptidase [Vibrio sp. D431a]|uniref:ImmA/IrrE family metallo-endopeptidase n=1 Tax=Vibrio sp. D431a TaxID=2837388 RepID=UPI002554CEAD|nr:hypothetical protein [Vibrio sp. D431a]MDK9790656.1 hypothetical protein [Vibrio sp. D431a]